MHVYPLHVCNVGILISFFFFFSFLFIFIFIRMRVYTRLCSYVSYKNIQRPEDMKKHGSQRAGLGLRLCAKQMKDYVFCYHVNNNNFCTESDELSVIVVC